MTSEAHPYWVDWPAGFTTAEREALVLHFLTYAPDPRTLLRRPALSPLLLREALAVIQ